MEYRALSKYLRVSTRKVRLVVDSVKKMSLDRAVDELRAMNKHAGGDVLKVLMSAIANAKGYNKNQKDLRIKLIDVSGGPSMKRFHAVSKGTGHSYKKRMTHVRVVLEDIKGA